MNIDCNVMQVSYSTESIKSDKNIDLKEELHKHLVRLLMRRALQVGSSSSSSSEPWPKISSLKVKMFYIFFDE